MQPSLPHTVEDIMTTTQITTTPADLLELREAQDDAFLSQFDDEALEQALKTVHWHPKDVSQFLRAATRR
jgi:hypothetical protein